MEVGSSCFSSRCQQYNPLLSFLSPSSKVQVLYGGTDLFDYEVRRTFNNDMLLAFISSSCIAALVYILTSCSGRPPWKAQQEPAPFSPSCVLLSGQSLPSPECQKSSQIHVSKDSGEGCSEITFQSQAGGLRSRGSLGHT